MISIQEEVEQDLIERNIIVDPDKGVTSCKLPFLVDPESRLVPNDNGCFTGVSAAGPEVEC